jgi:hypothetical protein
MSYDYAIRFHVGVSVTAEAIEEFRLSFDLSGGDRDVIIRCNRDLSESEGQRLENLVANFIDNIADVISKAQ